MKHGLIIALRGEDKSGKSHVLRTVFNKLCEKGWKSILEKCVYKERSGKEIPQNVVSRDIEIRGAILKRDSRSETICLTTIGDKPVNLDNYLIDRLKHECEVYICGTRPRAGTVALVNGLEAEGYKVRWI